MILVCNRTIKEKKMNANIENGDAANPGAGGGAVPAGGGAAPVGADGAAAAGGPNAGQPLGPGGFAQVNAAIHNVQLQMNFMGTIHILRK